MTQAAPALWQLLQASAQVLAAVRSGRSAPPVLDSLDPALRAGAQALSLQVLRKLGLALALRRQLARREPPPAVDALLSTALALLASDRPSYPPHTLVAQAVEAAKRHPATAHQASFINGCLRRMLREQAQQLALARQQPQARWNHPDWWIARLRQDHPQHWQQVLASGDQPAALVLRINQRRLSRQECLQRWAEAGIEAEPVGRSGVQLSRSQPVTRLPGFTEGWFSVQDLAAQQAAPLLLEGLQAAGSRLRLLDACAAPGGKTAHLLEQADAEVLALDMDAGRIARVKQNLERLGLQARVTVADAAEPQAWWDGRLFDGILLDAPCTASGIVRRHPDVRWLRRESDVTALAQQQARLLQALWPLLRPGGHLLYCTCSVFKAEGQEQVQAFLARHKEAQLRPSPGHLLPGRSTLAPSMPDNPGGEHDGFFYALLERGAS